MATSVNKDTRLAGNISSGGELGRQNNLQKIAQKKAQVRSFPKNKKLEKMGIYSSCKVRST